MENPKDHFHFQKKGMPSFEDELEIEEGILAEEVLTRHSKDHTCIFSALICMVFVTYVGHVEEVGVLRRDRHNSHVPCRMQTPGSAAGRF